MSREHEFPSSVALSCIMSPSTHKQKQRPGASARRTIRKQLSCIPSPLLRLARTGSRLGPRSPKRQQRSAFQHGKVLHQPQSLHLDVCPRPGRKHFRPY